MSDKTFKPDLNRPPPVVDSEIAPAGPLGFTRRYRMGNSRFSVPVTADEADIIAGIGYLNNLRNQRNRSTLAKFVLRVVAPNVPDPTDPFGRFIADSGREYSIRPNRDADVTIWGEVT